MPYMASYRPTCSILHMQGGLVIEGDSADLAGMKKSEFIVAVNTDKDAPIGKVADVLVVADLKQFVPTLTEKLKAL
jgi:electron transfer flavoprotein alpha subunit